MLIGVWWLGERLDSSPALLAGECAAAVLVIGAIAFITVRGQHLVARADVARADADTPAARTHPGRIG